MAYTGSVMKQVKMQLYTKILLGMPGGVVVGLAAHRCGETAAGFVLSYVKPFGTLFIRLISMVVVPLVFASLVVGTASLDDVRQLGRIGVKTLVFYLCTTVIAISGGLLLAHLFQPGQGLDAETTTRLLEQSQEKIDTHKATLAEKPTLTDVLLDIVPRNPLRAFIDGNMLQIIFFALVFGICLALIPESEAQPVRGFFGGINAIMIQIVHGVMRVAPYGVFALMSAVIADLGAGILVILLKYAAAVIVGLLLHMAVVYSLAVGLLSPVRIRRFFQGIRPAQLIAFSSGSSSATLPVTIECTHKHLGVPRKIGSFVLPLGATINMDGTALFQGVSAVFRVEEPFTEFLQPSMDKERMLTWAGLSGGNVYDPWGTGKLPEEIATKSRLAVIESTSELWDAPFWVFLFVALSGAEWFLRKWMRLP